jgi:hypothetical protein
MVPKIKIKNKKYQNSSLQHIHSIQRRRKESLGLAKFGFSKPGSKSPNRSVQKETQTNGYVQPDPVLISSPENGRTLD